MAIALNATTQDLVLAGTATSTSSHTTAGSDRILFILVVDEADSTLSNITYGGVAATFVNSMTDGGGYGKVSLYRLINPASGANNVSVTRSNTTNRMAVFAISYTGVDQTNPIDGSVVGSTAAGQTTITNSITTTVANDWMLKVHYAPLGGLAASTNSTQRGSTVTMFNGQAGIFDTNGPITSAGSFSMTTTQNSNYSGSVAVAFKPVQAIAVTIDAAALSAAFSLPSSTVTATQNVTISPATLSASFSLPAATVTGAATAAPNPLTAIFSLPQSEIQVPDVSITPSSLTASFSLPTPALQTDQNLALSPLSAIFSLPTPLLTVVSHITVTPSPLSSYFALPARTREGGIWENQDKASTSWGNQSKASTSWGNQSKTSTNWTNQEKSEI